MVMISENFASLLEPKLRQIFFEAYLQIPAMRDRLFSVQTSGKAKETDYGIGAFAEWKEFTGSLDYDSFYELWEIEYEHTEFAKGFKVERKLVDDNQYNVIFNRAQRLGASAFRKAEADAASVFNNAFSGSYLGYDSIALCGSHPYSPTNASTQANAGTTALSRDALITTRTAMREYKDDRGNPIYVVPDMLLIPIELEDTAYRIVQSAQVSGTADNDANFLRGRFQVVSWELLSDANNWFLIDSRMMKQFLLWFDRVPLEFGAANEFDTMLAKFRAYMRYSYGWSDWRWIYGQNVT